ncbi:hypothetical protein [Streptomyces sp. NPDC001380]|uniref:hypothetical protein n=1 Tax=Streptomyces sp. NPDC001380 TaxID=3364566 RepID=UPI0036B374C3
MHSQASAKPAASPSVDLAKAERDKRYRAASVDMAAALDAARVSKRFRFTEDVKGTIDLVTHCGIRQGAFLDPKETGRVMREMSNQLKQNSWRDAENSTSEYVHLIRDDWSIFVSANGPVPGMNIPELPKEVDIVEFSAQSDGHDCMAEWR